MVGSGSVHLGEVSGNPYGIYFPAFLTLQDTAENKLVQAKKKARVSASKAHNKAHKTGDRSENCRHCVGYVQQATVKLLQMSP